VGTPKEEGGQKYPPGQGTKVGEVVGEERNEAVGRCEDEREGAVLADGCTEAVGRVLAEVERVGPRVALALSGTSQQEALLLAPASEK
jgi:hypothetical protein